MEQENNLELSEGNVLCLKTCGFNEDISDKEVRLKCLELACKFGNGIMTTSDVILIAKDLYKFVVNEK